MEQKYQKQKRSATTAHHTFLAVSTPKGDTHVERGQDPFYLYCHLNPDFGDFKQVGARP